MNLPLRALTFLVPAFALSLGLSGSAHAGLGCFDVCTEDANGETCMDYGQGCNPNTNRCMPCFDDTWCAPNGTCQPDGSCTNVICSGTDAGITDAVAPDTGTATITDAGFSPDAAAPDAAPAIDAGNAPPDTGVRRVENPPYIQPPEEGCTCVRGAPRTQGPWAIAALLFAGQLARRRQTRRRASMGSTRKSAESRV